MMQLLNIILSIPSSLALVKSDELEVMSDEKKQGRIVIGGRATGRPPICDMSLPDGCFAALVLTNPLLDVKSVAILC